MNGLRAVTRKGEAPIGYLSKPWSNFYRSVVVPARVVIVRLDDIRKLERLRASRRNPFDASTDFLDPVRVGQVDA